MKRYTLLLLVLLASNAGAHAVDFQVDHAQATVVQLTYRDGTPFAFESYEISTPGDWKSFQIGHTDLEGRLSFIPDRPGDWSIKVHSADGHGIQTTIHVDDNLVPEVTRTDRTISRLTRILGGLFLIALVTLTLMINKRRKER
jgi:nickel transport protein